MHRLLQIQIHMVYVSGGAVAVPLAVFVASLLGCTVLDSGSEGKRTITSAPLEVVWQRDIGSDDSTLALPSKLAIADGVIGVLDPSLNRVIGISSANGEDAWVYSASGGGPSEIRAASDIVVDEHGNFVVLDAGNGKIVRLDKRGRFIGEQQITSAGPRSVCLTDGAQAVVSQLSLGAPLVRVSLEKGTATPLRFPWGSESGGLPSVGGGGDASEYVRLTQSILLAIGKSRCVVARQTAPGVALLEHDSISWSAQEPDVPPVDSLRSMTSTAIAAAQLGSTIMIAYHGVGALRGKLIDRYRVSDGHYLGTWEAPDHISWLSARGNKIAVLKMTSTGGRISLWQSW